MENSETHEQRLDLLVLARLWCAGEKPIKPGAVVTSLKAFSADALADAVNRSIDRLMSDQKIERIAPTKKGAKPEFKISPNGSANLRSRLGSLPATVPTFLAFSNSYLAAQATGLPVPMDAKSLKAFGKLLPAEICARHHHFAIPLDVGPDPARLALVKLALARSQDLPTDAIWLKKLPAGELPALVVAPLLGLKGTKASNLDKLLESEACRILNVSKPSQIRLGAIRLWLTGRSNDKPDALAEEKTNSFATEPAAKDFAVAVLTAARKAAHLDRRAVNNLGDQVLIHYCWEQYCKDAGATDTGATYTGATDTGATSLPEFKRRLSELNGEHLVLVREDLIPDGRAEEFAESEVKTGVSCYHYIRLMQGK